MLLHCNVAGAVQRHLALISTPAFCGAVPAARTTVLGRQMNALIRPLNYWRTLHRLRPSVGVGALIRDLYGLLRRG
jgi:hypothetical protein